MTSSPFSAERSPAASPCRLLLADDHRIVRAAVRCLLETVAAIRVVAEAGDGAEAVARIAELEPDVALVDVAMPGLNGIEVMRRVAAAGHRTRLLAFTAYDTGQHVREALAAGAAGFVPKSAAATDLVAAIRTVAAGGHYVHPAVLNVTLATLLHERQPHERGLSAREAEVLRLLAHGYAAKEVSAQLAVSIKTVETYKARAMEKIGARSRVDLMRFAATQGWLDS